MIIGVGIKAQIHFLTLTLYSSSASSLAILVWLTGPLTKITLWG